MFSIILVDPRSQAHRLRVNKFWKLETLMKQIDMISLDKKPDLIAIDDYTYTLKTDGGKALHELGIVPNKQVSLLVFLVSGRI